MCVVHNHGIMHCDLRLNHILVHVVDVDKGFVLKLAHFNNARNRSDGLDTIITTDIQENYSPPEVNNKSAHDIMADCYSLGVIFANIVHGEMPFACREDWLNNTMRQFKKTKSTFEATMDTLIKQLLDSDPDKRPTVHEML